VNPSARTLVPLLRPAEAHPTSVPRASRTLPTAAPIDPGCTIPIMARP
jgi:hypothetical protein